MVSVVEFEPEPETVLWRQKCAWSLDTKVVTGRANV
jgi:hypothetical protein